MFDENKFTQIFGEANTQYQKGKRDCFESNGKQSNNPDYLKGYKAQENIERRVQANG